MRYHKRPRPEPTSEEFLALPDPARSARVRRAVGGGWRTQAA